MFFGEAVAAGVPGLTNAVGICPWGVQMPGNSFGGLLLVMITLDILGMLVGTVQYNSGLTLLLIIGTN